MQKVLQLTMMMLLPFLAMASYPADALEGRWFDYNSGVEIKVKAKRYGLKVKGLYGSRRWVKFEHLHRNEFIDCDRNVLLVDRRGRLSYIPHRRGHRLRFERGRRHQSPRGNNQCYTTRVEYYDDHRHRDDRRNQYQDYSNNNRDDYYGAKRSSYYVRELEEYIEIEQTSNGLRARRSGQPWVIYDQNRYRKNEYSDRKGNRYIRLDDNTFKWKDVAGLTSLTLTRR